ncbi:hypothetical protein H1P_3110008 [Hyella patelloides LEGE 07179]|uniref:Uncharacterized protein n=1 Tax=Hyella patelloides LEGE 07179 TaxID=945734 RepID=A0A563VUU5_9CYAN|nr:hypothetical protein H1P_3110008 [Hyella patelloides LEGE 07179]
MGEAQLTMLGNCAVWNLLISQQNPQTVIAKDYHNKTNRLFVLPFFHSLRTINHCLIYHFSCR